MTYQIETTGMDGAFAYRYQYSIDNSHGYFGYAETLEEAEEILRNAGVKMI